MPTYDELVLAAGFDTVQQRRRDAPPLHPGAAARHARGAGRPGRRPSAALREAAPDLSKRFAAASVDGDAPGPLPGGARPPVRLPEPRSSGRTTRTGCGATTCSRSPWTSGRSRRTSSCPVRALGDAGAAPKAAVTAAVARSEPCPTGAPSACAPARPAQRAVGGEQLAHLVLGRPRARIAVQQRPGELQVGEVARRAGGRSGPGRAARARRPSTGRCPGIARSRRQPRSWSAARAGPRGPTRPRAAARRSATERPALRPRRSSSAGAAAASVAADGRSRSPLAGSARPMPADDRRARSRRRGGTRSAARRSPSTAPRTARGGAARAARARADATRRSAGRRGTPRGTGADRRPRRSRSASGAIASSATSRRSARAPKTTRSRAGWATCTRTGSPSTCSRRSSTPAAAAQRARPSRSAGVARARPGGPPGGRRSRLAVQQVDVDEERPRRRDVERRTRPRRRAGLRGRPARPLVRDDDGGRGARPRTIRRRRPPACGRPARCVRCAGSGRASATTTASTSSASPTGGDVRRNLLHRSKATAPLRRGLLDLAGRLPDLRVGRDTPARRRAPAAARTCGSA